MLPAPFARPPRVGIAALVAFALGAIVGAARCTLNFDPATLPPGGTDASDVVITPVGCTSDAACMLANATAVCSMGACVVSQCTTGFADCNGVPNDGCETNTQDDPSNCGICRNACTVGANARPACAAGICHADCATDFEDCDQDAANGCEVALRSPDTCGGCGHGACSPPTGVCGSLDDGGVGCVAGCGPGQTSCGDGGTCANTQLDTSNCGACGHVCPAGATCMSGTCVCPTGQTPCGGACVNTMTDRLHCGGCATTCHGANSTCCNGSCQVACLGG